MRFLGGVFGVFVKCHCFFFVVVDVLGMLLVIFVNHVSRVETQQDVYIAKRILKMMDCRTVRDVMK